MSFQVPNSSSPPSTPDKKSSSVFSFGGNNPSTTPAGPPPSSARSFTPAGPPPISFLGSSVTDSSFYPTTRRSSSPHDSADPDPSPSHKYQRLHKTVDAYGRSEQYPPATSTGFRVPSNSGDTDDEGRSEYSEEGEDADYRDYGDGEDIGEMESEYDEDQGMQDAEPDIFDSIENPRHFGASDHLLPSREAFDQSVINFDESTNFSRTSHAQNSPYAQIAKDLFQGMDRMIVAEADDLILNTEVTISNLYDKATVISNDDTALQSILSETAGELISLWSNYEVEATRFVEHTSRIGPAPASSNFTKANFLAGITLIIHHHQRDPQSYDGRFKPLPQTLLEWLDEHHDPYPSQIEEVQTHRPGPSNHPFFWQVVLNGLLRGKVAAVAEIMRNGGWRYARGGQDDFAGQNDKGSYTGMALANVEKVVAAATQVLAHCPAMQGNWNIRSSDWTLFRVRASQAKDDLRNFAEGKDNSETGSKAIQPGTYSANAQRAQSRVPWHIYQNLLTFYNFLLGDRDAITSNAADWCEATIGLLAWWDEAREDRKVALGRSQSNNRAVSRSTDSDFYVRKLRKALDITAPTNKASELGFNPIDPIEVGLASLLAGDIESVIALLRAWSGPLSSAVVEIGSLAGWLPHTEPQSLINMGNLDEEDYGLLGISSPSKSDSVKDTTLIAYARALPDRRELKSTKSFGKSQVTRAGWEIAITILGRLDSSTRSEETIGELVKGFELESADTVDKLWTVLNDVGMTRHARSTAETYADFLAEDSHKYGEALWYYALSHNPRKVKDVLDLLISYSLIQSLAYPPEPELDDHLKRLLHSPRDALLKLSMLDVEAAELLHQMLTGYATLRRFYALRDMDVVVSNSGNASTSARGRRAEAISALMAVISSSDDNIRGGLYDEQRGAVVSVDFLLALLGEAMVFINQPGVLIDVPHIETLLKTIEDVQSVGSRIYSACTGFLQTVLASAPGLKGSSPADMLRKSTSNLSGISSFSLVGSSMLASQMKQSMGSSGVLVKENIKRGWDWRQGVTASTTAEDLLKILRLGLARDLAKAWMAQADTIM